MLTLLVEPRKTLQTFLMTSGKSATALPLTTLSAQIQLLDNYYRRLPARSARV
jgi:hypothetical protein